jgi:hypothetical protein
MNLPRKCVCGGDLSKRSATSQLVSSRAKRGICCFANSEEKADSSGTTRPRNDELGRPSHVCRRHRVSAAVICETAFISNLKFEI